MWSCLSPPIDDIVSVYNVPVIPRYTAFLMPDLPTLLFVLACFVKVAFAIHASFHLFLL